MPAQLSTHVLDTAHGCPASGMAVELWSLNGEARTLIKATKTNADGRTDKPLLAGGDLKVGQYELVFYVGDYFAAKAPAAPAASTPARFFDKVPVRFGIADPGAGWHVPLLCSPWSYATYRGS